MSKKYFNIREVSEFLNIKEHVIRYWDSIDPKTKKLRIDGISTKSRGGTRYFNRENIEKLDKLKTILYENGNQIQSLKLAEKLINSKKRSKIIENDAISTNDRNISKSEKLNQILGKMRYLLK